MNEVSKSSSDVRQILALFRSYYNEELFVSCWIQHKFTSSSCENLYHQLAKHVKLEEYVNDKIRWVGLVVEVDFRWLIKWQIQLNPAWRRTDTSNAVADTRASDHETVEGNRTPDRHCDYFTQPPLAELLMHILDFRCMIFNYERNDCNRLKTLTWWIKDVKIVNWIVSRGLADYLWRWCLRSEPPSSSTFARCIVPMSRRMLSERNNRNSLFARRKIFEKSRGWLNHNDRQKHEDSSGLVAHLSSQEEPWSDWYNLPVGTEATNQEDSHPWLHIVSSDRYEFSKAFNDDMNMLTLYFQRPFDAGPHIPKIPSTCYGRTFDNFSAR